VQLDAHFEQRGLVYLAVANVWNRCWVRVSRRLLS
jgi:hypothetical protein